MQKIYKILNPATGEYEPAATLDECTTKLSDIVWKFYLGYAHQQPYSIVEVHDDGSETWRNPAGDEIASPEEILQKIKQKATDYTG